MYVGWEKIGDETTSSEEISEDWQQYPGPGIDPERTWKHIEAEKHNT